MRRKKHEEHVNHEAWAIPYADLMTLLLAFFVVMYAVSVVNEGKFRVMSRSIDEAFNGTSHVIAPLGPSMLAPHSLAPPMTQSGTLGKALLAPINAPIAMIRPPEPAARAGGIGRPGTGGSVATAAMSSLDHIEGEVRRALQPLVDKNWVAVRRTQDWLEIDIRTDILFPSGVAQLSASSDQVLQNLATILAPFANPLRVEGFTDNVPISTAQYPSNWELSAARAASVARLFASEGVDPDRLGIVGWGEVRPIADNATVDGRNHNRRVLVVVMSDTPAPAHAESPADRIVQDGVIAARQEPAMPTHEVVYRAAAAGAAMPATPATLPGLPVVATISVLAGVAPLAPASIITTDTALPVRPRPVVDSTMPQAGVSSPATAVR